MHISCLRYDYAFNMHLDSNIKTLRKKAGLTQKELAQQLDKTYITIGDYERGKILPPLNVILQLCDIFAVDLQTLVFHDMATQGTDPAPTAPDLAAENERLRNQLRTQQQLTSLQAEHLATLKREIREQAPGLAERLGLE